MASESTVYYSRESFDYVRYVRKCWAIDHHSVNHNPSPEVPADNDHIGLCDDCLERLKSGE